MRSRASPLRHRGLSSLIRSYRDPNRQTWLWSGNGDYLFCTLLRYGPEHQDLSGTDAGPLAHAGADRARHTIRSAEHGKWGRLYHHHSRRFPGCSPDAGDPSRRARDCGHGRGLWRMCTTSLATGLACPTPSESFLQYAYQSLAAAGTDLRFVPRRWHYDPKDNFGQGVPELIHPYLANVDHLDEGDGRRQPLRVHRGRRHLARYDVWAGCRSTAWPRPTRWWTRP